MIEKLLIIDGPGFNPYSNMALEEYLLFHVKKRECILYLWQNHKTVVIGRNQNCWKECRVAKLEADGGYLARRLSGGGAVFHDLGNLNFTFICRKEDYDVLKQTQVILESVRFLGINAKRTGRNDITVDGMKFSGNAYYQSGDFCYHHGTLLLRVDKLLMSEYLKVSKEKLQSKSVDSVKSRVTNLSEYAPDISPVGMREKLLEAFALVYRRRVEEYPEDRLDREEIGRLSGRFESWKWKYGRKIPFTDEICRRFSWGEVQIQLEVDGGRIKDARIWSDALSTDITCMIERSLFETVFRAEDLREAVSKVPVDSLVELEIKKDVMELASAMP